jgi:branched-chain amino acid transport system permease protein
MVGIAKGPLLLLVLTGTILLVPLVLPPFYRYLATELVIWGLLAISLDLLIGYTGLPSFGHAIFFGVPAYVLGIVAMRSESMIVALLAALASIAVLTTVVGYVATRTGGIGYIIVTLLCSFAMFIGALTWTSMTGGENGLYLPAKHSLSGMTSEARYLLVAAIGLAVWGCAAKLVNSSYGLVLLGIKANERRMQAMGYDIERIKFQITAVSGAIAGLAGILYAVAIRTISPELVGPELSTEIVIWVLLGGAQTLFGPIFGAALFISLKQVLSSVPAYPILLGLLFIAVVTWAPTGLVKLRTFPRSRRGLTGTSDRAAGPSETGGRK